jgi:hypothetical protein
MELTTELIICAPPAVVWDVLLDFAAYPEWNPFIVEIAGRPVVGARLEARMVPPGTKGIRLRPVVRAVVAERELRWKGSLMVPGVLDGEHSFLLEPHEQGTRFVQSERFTGLLVALFRRSLDTDTRRGFEEMNRALRDRAEQLAGDEATSVVE